MDIRLFFHSKFGDKMRKALNAVCGSEWERRHRPSLSQRVRNEFYYMFNRTKCVVVSGWLVGFYDSKERYSNWGDDLNVYLIERMTGKKVIPAKTLLLPHAQYSFIGSNIPGFVNGRTTVWGSGVLDTKMELKAKVKNVCAVRGPITRNYLMAHGCACPKVFGDPALLLPQYYSGKAAKKKTKIGLIPHHRDFDDEASLVGLLGEHAHVINVTKYGLWTDVIDEICSCECVLSSSLHGLIVADAYGVKNAFCEFAYHHPNYDKYMDYFMSVGRPLQSPMQYDGHISVDDKRFNAQINIDIETLRSRFPVK